MKTKFAKQFVNIQLHSQDGYFKVFVKGVGVEAGATVYFCQYEDGTEEPIFIDSIYRIWQSKKAKVIRPKVWRTKLTLVK